MYTNSSCHRFGMIIIYCLLQVGVTMAQVSIHPDMLEACVRDELNNTATRFVALRHC